MRYPIRLVRMMWTSLSTGAPLTRSRAELQLLSGAAVTQVRGADQGGHLLALPRLGMAAKAGEAARANFYRAEQIPERDEQIPGHEQLFSKGEPPC